MTALEQFIRLEAPGRWRAPGSEDWREVLVSFGNATLVLSSFDEDPLTHWSLAATRRVAEDGTAATYAPDMDSDEVLEISDTLMIEAIREVTAQARGARVPAATRRGWLRPWMAVVAVLALAVAAAVLYVPDLLKARALALMPQARAELLDEQIAATLTQETCRGAQGQRALSALLAKVAPGSRALVIQRDQPPVARLPGGALVLSQKVVEGAASAEALAGWIALAEATPPSGTALALWIDAMTVREVAGFLASARINQGDVMAMGGNLARAPFAPADAQVIQAVERLAALSLTAAPFLSELSVHRPADGIETVLQIAAPPLMSDQAWVTLQGVCAG